MDLISSLNVIVRVGTWVLLAAVIFIAWKGNVVHHIHWLAAAALLLVTALIITGIASLGNPIALEHGRNINVVFSVVAGLMVLSVAIQLYCEWRECDKKKQI